MSGRRRRARVQDVHDVAAACRTPRWSAGAAETRLPGGREVLRLLPHAAADAVDPDTGDRYPDVIIFWVASEADKSALVQDPDSPFFTTPHFDGHLSVLVRASRLPELSRDEVVEVVQDAWLCRASTRRRTAWLAEHGVPD
jgi:hypothetical protein